MPDELNPYPGNLKNYKVEGIKLEGLEISMDQLVQMRKDGANPMVVEHVFEHKRINVEASILSLRDSLLGVVALHYAGHTASYHELIGTIQHQLRGLEEILKHMNKK